MATPDSGNLYNLLLSLAGAERTERLFQTLNLPDSVAHESGPRISRACLAQALNMLLFEDLLARVPAAKSYVEYCLEHGAKITHDHGAVRTVAREGMGALPAGQKAITRILEPLGYGLNGVYPLEKLKMTGRSWAQSEDKEGIAQFFLSELHPERFSPEFQQAVKHVTETSSDPIDVSSSRLLAQLTEAKALPLEDARKLLPVMVSCFARQHAIPKLSDYEVLLAESAEMAWISTEGNAFNHVTDRVTDVDALSEEQKRIGQPMKEVVEKSQSGRVRQTAFHAARVQREFRTADGIATKEVPGSFLEFITRLSMPDSTALDLSFDSSNAQAIFKMTADAAGGPSARK